MSTTRCVYCGRYAKNMIGNKCTDCLKEYREVKAKIENRVIKQEIYTDNILPFKMVAK